MLTRGRRIVPRAGMETRDGGHANQGQARCAAELHFGPNLGVKEMNKTRPKSHRCDICVSSFEMLMSVDVL